MKGESKAVKMSQMYQTEICQCGKLKQLGRECKFCGLALHTQQPEYADGVYELPKAVAKAVPVEDEMEYLRR